MADATKKSYDTCRIDDQGRTVCCTNDSEIYTSAQFSRLAVETPAPHCDILTDEGPVQATNKPVEEKE